MSLWTPVPSLVTLITYVGPGCAQCNQSLVSHVLPVGVGHFPQDEVPAVIAAMLDAFVDECAVEYEASSAGQAAQPGQCRSSLDGQLVEGFSLRGLMAAAEMDPKV